MTGDHFDLKSLATFTRVLEVAGYFRVPVQEPLVYRGPIRAAFSGLTSAKVMDIVIRPGWPFVSPALFVEGLSSNHLTRDGFVCMWQDGDADLGWTNVTDFFARIDEWCARAQNGWEGDDLGQDAQMNFDPQFAVVATFDYFSLGIHIDGWGVCHGVMCPDPYRLDILSGGASASGHLRGLWCHAGTLSGPPPRNLDEVYSCLSETGRQELSLKLDARQSQDPLSASGGLDFLILCWERQGRPYLLVMAFQGLGNSVSAVALQPGPLDHDSLILRAGPDAPTLGGVKVAVFGLGALGGHVALALANSGVGSLNLVDGDLLLPGNVVRHAAGSRLVGQRKALAVQSLIGEHAPWTTVSSDLVNPVTPQDILERVRGVDLVVDATGNGAFTYSVSVVAANAGVPLISGALYRGGFVGRVQRQAGSTDVLLHGRDASSGFLDISPGAAEADFAVPALGCSAPVNNAPPASVLACASLITQGALDVLCQRFQMASEVVEIYRPLPEIPFDRVGRIAFGMSPNGS